MNKDLLGDRMKSYEMVESERYLMRGLPIMMRLDGKNFSSFTKGLNRPYDVRLSNLMIDTSKFLVEETNAVISFCQSDEISLVLYTDDSHEQLFFDGRIQKLTSVVASMATAFFNRELPKRIPEKADKFAYFDCRVWNVPSLSEAANTLIWRELDATKNAISMAAQHYYSHNELHEKNGSEKQEMLFAKGVNFNDYPSYFKRGSYVQRVQRLMKFSTDELARLPEKHEARRNPDLVYERSVVERVDLPPMTKVVNKVDVFFNGAEPITREIV